MGICLSGLHVFCGSREGLRPGPLRVFVGDTTGIWGSWPAALSLFGFHGQDLYKARIMSLLFADD